MCVKDFVEIGRVVSVESRECILIDLDDFEEMSYSESIETIFYKGQGIYEAIDIEGNRGLFYPVDMMA